MKKLKRVIYLIATFIRAQNLRIKKPPSEREGDRVCAVEGAGGIKNYILLIHL